METVTLARYDWDLILACVENTKTEYELKGMVHASARNSGLVKILRDLAAQIRGELATPEMPTFQPGDGAEDQGGRLRI